MQSKRFILGGILWVSYACCLPAGVRESESFWKGHSSSSTVNIVSFGDSIASGFSISRIFKRVEGGTYADKAGSALCHRIGKNVQVYNLARVGYRIEKIYKLLTTTHLEKVKNSNFIILQGGGVNLYLDSILNLNLVTDITQKMLSFAKEHQKKGALIGIYYPHLENFKDTYQASILNTLAQANWKNRKAAMNVGYQFIDVFSQLNCTSEGQSLCRIENARSLTDYKLRLEKAFKNHYFVGMKKLGFAQKDNVHPNSKGHSVIAQDIFF